MLNVGNIRQQMNLIQQTVIAKELLTDNDLLAIRETLLPLIVVIPYDQLKGIHSLTAILTEAVKYEADHGSKKMNVPPASPSTIFPLLKTPQLSSVFVQRRPINPASLTTPDSIYEADERGIAKVLCNVVGEVWYNDLKDAKMFYTKVMAINIMALLDANSGGLHAVDMISLRTNMMQYYVQADGIPQFIVMMEDAQKKAKRVGMPITNVELVMMALVAVLAAQHFLCEVDDWEGLPVVHRTWRAWKIAFRLAHLKHQHQLQAPGGMNRWVVPTPSSPLQPPPSTAWEQLLTTSHSRQPTTPQSYSRSSRRRTWCSPCQMPCSLRPTRSSHRL